MTREHRSSTGDEYEPGADADVVSPWPGKRALTTSLAGAGEPLPARIADGAERAYGSSVSDVRVHTDSGAATSANRLGAEAFTRGTDVYFASGKYDPESEHGRFVLMHEVAHVVQGRGAEPATQARLEIGESSDPAEHEADQAAEAALEGRPAQLTRREGRLRRFGAGTVKYDPKKPKGGQFSVEPGGHAALTVGAAKELGLDTDQAALAYQGNWMRDLSQAMVPGLVDKLKAERILAIMQIMSIKEFGRGFDEAEFGTYDPVEHMDNPTDLRASDVFQQYERGPDGKPVGVDGNALVPIAGVVTVVDADKPGQLAPAGAADQAYADTDERYQATAKNMPGTINKGDAVAFQVDQSAIPVYMNTSKDWCKATLRKSATLGRDNPKGPREFGSGIHVMQDYYAHSNFCEIAINSLIKAGELELPDETGKKVKVDKKARIDSHVHKNGPDGEPVKSVNLKVKDLPGYNGQPNGDREVMSTGSFNLTDTAVSLLHVMKEKIVDLNPFKEKGKGPSAITNAVLDYLDMEKPDGFNKTGKKIAAIIRPVGDAVSAVGDGLATGVEFGGKVAKGGVGVATDTGTGFFDLLNKGNALLGGDADYWDKEKKAVQGAGDAVGGAISGQTEAAAKKIREVSNWLNDKADEIEKREHILRDVYAWWSGIDMLAPVKAMAKAIPVVGEKVAKLITDLQKKIKETSEQILDDLWVAATKIILAKIQSVIDWLTKRTSITNKKKAGKPGGKAGPEWLPEKVRAMLGDKQAELDRLLGGVGDMYNDDGTPKNGIAPKSYTPPSHSEVAKDHHAEEGAVHAGEHEEDHAGGDEGHGAGDSHAHGGDWLNRMAESLAGAATKAIASKVGAAWDEVPLGVVNPARLEAIDAEVDAWFRHPDDCKSKWEGTAKGFLSDPGIAARLRAEIAKGTK